MQIRRGRDAGSGHRELLHYETGSSDIRHVSSQPITGRPRGSERKLLRQREAAPGADEENEVTIATVNDQKRVTLGTVTI